MKGKAEGLIRTTYREPRKIPLSAEQLETIKTDMESRCRDMGLTEQEVKDYVRISCRKYYVDEDAALSF